MGGSFFFFGGGGGGGGGGKGYVGPPPKLLPPPLFLRLCGNKMVIFFKVKRGFLNQCPAFLSIQSLDARPENVERSVIFQNLFLLLFASYMIYFSPVGFLQISQESLKPGV